MGGSGEWQNGKKADHFSLLVDCIHHWEREEIHRYNILVAGRGEIKLQSNGNHFNMHLWLSTGTAYIIMFSLSI